MALRQRQTDKHKFTWFFIYFLFLSDEGPMLVTLDYTSRIGSTPTFLYFYLLGCRITWMQNSNRMAGMNLKVLINTFQKTYYLNMQSRHGRSLVRKAKITTKECNHNLFLLLNIFFLFVRKWSIIVLKIKIIIEYQWILVDWEY